MIDRNEYADKNDYKYSGNKNGYYVMKRRRDYKIKKYQKEDKVKIDMLEVLIIWLLK